jgi:hypothetical protein
MLLSLTFHCFRGPGQASLRRAGAGAGDANMLRAKLSRGFLEVFGDDGIHYVKPSLLERLQLIWMFRHFSVLSQQVLSERQQQLVCALCSRERMVPCLDLNERESKALIGKLETTILSMPCPEERRRNPRTEAQFEVRYGIGRRLFEGQGCNYSAGGLAFTGPRQFPAGAELELRYRSKPQAEWIHVRALVRHRDGEVMGVEFLSDSEN